MRPGTDNREFVVMSDRPMKRAQFIANVLARVVGRAGSIAANVVAVALMARALDPAAFGQVMFLLTLVAIFAQVADFGTTSVMARLVIDHRAKPGVLWAEFLRVRAALAVVAMILAVAYLVLASVDAPPAWIVIAVLSIPLVAARFFDAIFQVFELAWSIASAYLVFGGVLVALVGAAAWAGGGGVVFMVAHGLASAAYVLAAMVSLRSVLRPEWRPVLRSEPALRQRIWQMAIPVGIGGLFTTVNSRGSVMVVEYYRDSVEVALFTAALRVLDLAIAVAMVLVGPLLPAFSSAMDDLPRLQRLYREVLRLVLVGIVPAVLAAPVWADPLVRLLYGERYLAAAPAVALIVVVGALALLNVLNSYVLLALHQVRFAMWLTGSAATAGMALNLWLVPRHGYLAAAAVAVLIEAGMLCVTFGLVRRAVGPVFEARTWLPLAGAGLAMAVPLYLYPLADVWLGLAAGLVAYGAVAGVGGLWRIDRRALAA